VGTSVGDGVGILVSTRGGTAPGTGLVASPPALVAITPVTPLNAELPGGVRLSNSLRKVSGLRLMDDSATSPRSGREEEAVGEAAASPGRARGRYSPVMTTEKSRELDAVGSLLC